MKRIFVFVMALALLVVMVSGASVAGASASQTVSGTWKIVSAVPVSANPVGRNCIVELVATSAFEGDIVGTIEDHLKIVQFSPCDQPGAEVFLGHGDYQGTVLGASGVLQFVAYGTGDALGGLQGQIVFRSGTGGLAGLSGIITLSGDHVGGTYTGKMLINP